MYECIWGKLIDARSKYFKQSQKKKEKEIKAAKKVLDDEDDIKRQGMVDSGPHCLIVQQPSAVLDIVVEVKHSNGMSVQDAKFKSNSRIIDLKEYILERWATPIEQ